MKKKFLWNYVTFLFFVSPIVFRISELLRNFAAQAAKELADDLLQHCQIAMEYFSQYGLTSIKMSLTASYFGYLLINLSFAFNIPFSWKNRSLNIVSGHDF